MSLVAFTIHNSRHSLLITALYKDCTYHTNMRSKLCCVIRYISDTYQAKYFLSILAGHPNISTISALREDEPCRCADSQKVRRRKCHRQAGVQRRRHVLHRVGSGRRARHGKRWYRKIGKSDLLFLELVLSMTDKNVRRRKLSLSR